MKLFAIPLFILSLTFVSYSMEPETQLARPEGVSKTRQRVDNFVEALKEMEVTDDKALLNYRHPFFTFYARELIAEPQGKALGDECIKFLDRTITKHSDNSGTSYQEFYTFCLFTAVNLSTEPKDSDVDPVLENCSKFVRRKEQGEKEYGVPECYGDFFECLVNTINRTENNNSISFITMGTLYKFYPLILINNRFFRVEDYFYALSKRVYLLSLPYKASKGLHGGYYREPLEILDHDKGHLTHYGETHSGFSPFVFSEPLGANIEYKFDMYERVGQYFFDFLQRENIDDTSKKKLIVVGLSLTHENLCRKEVKFPTDSTPKSDLNYLIQCLRINLKKHFLPDCLKSVDDFKKSLAVSYIESLKLRYPKEIPAKMNKNLVKIEATDRPFIFKVRYKNLMSTACYETSKRKHVDWVKSAQRAGYTGTVSEDGMKYDPTPARNFHLKLLDWFEKNYLFKISDPESS